ncbi:SpoVR family protein [Consotaella salsifontis]|uniref:Stage V sporulation protein SpoVR/YcgB, involved in spore cortex formation n=1 Tax=Consotaella salsifontis TaxID=1365950 RepID=A0A1T4QU66_9HYPH|nr:SpoVR family protein [Consotaella salsifontis]SKA07167.1 Stage V sporulation protein SpoVR/YcgB, involved in spore cortex formation [Consotaella salsifontis]
MSHQVKSKDTLLFSDHDWDFDMLSRIYGAVEKIAVDEMGLDTYRNQIEVITAEQMLDAYAATGMPLLYKHWSFGKQFLRNETLYRKGWQGLAYEIVINSDPCIVYIMEENSATMQAIVLAHAAFGHNHFFKNNYVFQQWTDASAILDYLAFAKAYISSCEERYGLEAVERLIDAAHALQHNGVHRYPGKHSLDLVAEQRREIERREHAERLYNDLWRTLPKPRARGGRDLNEERRRALLGLPEENILYFLEKTAPRLAPWQREILRIVRQIAQYFYPQRQTKVMNEGCATFTHHRIMTRLHEKGQISDGAFLEFLQSHTNVVMQPEFDDRRYGGINPYALGFAMMQDIERIANEPTAEDRSLFPNFAGKENAYDVLRDAWANYRDESFILQFLSPEVIRKQRLFRLVDDPVEEDLVVAAIHDEDGYREVRRSLARQFDVARQDPDIQVVDVDLKGDRRLLLRHHVVDGVTLEAGDAARVLQHLANLWGYGVRLVEEDDQRTYTTLEAEPAQAFA